MTYCPVMNALCALGKVYRIAVNIAFYEPCVLLTSAFMNHFSSPFECLFMLNTSFFMNIGFYDPKMLVLIGFIKKTMLTAC